MEFFVVPLALSVLLVPVVLLQSVVESGRLRRDKQSAGSIVARARAMSSGGDFAGIRVLLESQRTRFAEGLLSVLRVEPDAAHSIATQWRAHEGEPRGFQRRLLGITTILLLAAALSESGLLAWICREGIGNPMDKFVFVSAAFVTWLAAGYGIYSIRRLDRARADLASHLAVQLLETASLFRRTPGSTA